MPSIGKLVLSSRGRFDVENPRPLERAKVQADVLGRAPNVNTYRSLLQPPTLSTRLRGPTSRLDTEALGKLNLEWTSSAPTLWSFSVPYEG